MFDKRKLNGGHSTKGKAGRKPLADELKTKTIMIKALKTLYDTDIDDEAKERFVRDVLMENQRGQLFVASHLFGKPKETIEATHTTTDFNIKEIFRVEQS
mgnify:FL=1